MCRPLAQLWPFAAVVAAHFVVIYLNYYVLVVVAFGYLKSVS